MPGCLSMFQRAGLTLVIFLLLAPLSAESCVGKILSIGIVDRPDQVVMAEILSQMVTERTGTTVRVTRFADSRALFDAVRQGGVGLVIESVSGASSLLGPSAPRDPEGVRGEFRKRFNLVWLKPWSVSTGHTPLVASDLLNSLPALPRLVNKLSPVVDDATLSRLVAAGRGESQVKKSVHEFLKSRKLI